MSARRFLHVTATGFSGIQPAEYFDESCIIVSETIIQKSYKFMSQFLKIAAQNRKYLLRKSVMIYTSFNDH